MGYRFDAGNVRNQTSEGICFEAPALALTPLVREPGALAVSHARLYFQPLHNVTGAQVASHPLSGIAAVARRRSALRPVGNMSQQERPVWPMQLACPCHAYLGVLAPAQPAWPQLSSKLALTIFGRPPVLQD